MKKKSDSLLKRFCLESTVLGLKYFYLYPDWVSRCFWAVNILAVFSLACQLAWMLYSRFDEMPTRITIENQYEPVKELPYPSITICSPNQMSIRAIEHFNRTLVNGNMSKSLDKVVLQLLGFFHPMVAFDKKELAHLQDIINLNRYTIPEVMTLLPQKCEDFLKVCRFQGRLYPQCKGLFRPILTFHGLCCSFNNIYYFRDKKRNEQIPNYQKHLVKNSGLTRALMVVTDYDPEDALDASVLIAGAARVLFTDGSEFPVDDEANLVLSNSESFHIIQATYTYCSEDVKQLPVWSRKCYLESEHNLRFFREYRNSDCDHLCFVMAVEEACHCLVFYVPYLASDRACNVTSLPCITDVKRHMNKWMSSPYCECPRDCESIRYKVDMAIGNLNALPYVVTNLYENYVFNKSSTVMHFYFPNPIYVKQKQETVMSLINLTSNLGGVFGLCIGCSAISLVEIIFYTYISLKNYVKNRRERRRARRTTNIKT